MKISSINYKVENSFQNKQINFKQGLPAWFIKEVKATNPSQVEAELAMKGLYADFKNVPAVAASCKKVVEIMEHYGFELPKQFSFEPLKGNTLGSYNTSSDKVRINSNFTCFKDIVLQNRLEESRGSYHPITGHFLQTYLHEFTCCTLQKYL